MDDWRPIETAPKDGTLVEIMAEDFGPYEMVWNPAGYNWLVSSSPGLWEDVGGNFTWCDERPEGAPTHWRPIAKGEDHA